MAGRFANLEFEGARQAQTAVALSEEVRNADFHLQKAHEARCWGDHEQALRLFTRCLQEDRKVIRAWVGQVQMLVELGEYAEARTWSDKALELFRNNGELAAAKAQACARVGALREALACSDAAMKSPGASAWRWMARGEVQLARRERHYDECFQRGLMEAGAEPYDRVLIARIYRHYDRATNALSYLKPLMETHPDQGYLWLERGQAEQSLGLSGAARLSYERCLSLNPKCQAARAALDVVRRRSWIRRLRGWARGWRR